MTDLGTDGTYNGKKGIRCESHVLTPEECKKYGITGNYPDASMGDGYVPHSGMERFRCPRCGCMQFKSYPQTAPADRSKTWTWEYVCAECGQGMGLTVKGDE